MVDSTSEFKYNLSVIIPVYNAEEYLTKSIDSILNNDFENYEIILINDGSTDKSAMILDRYANDFPFITVIHKDNSGVSDTRNMGIDKALGKYLFFLDADDFISRKALLSVYTFFEEHQDEVDLVTYPIKIYKNGRVVNHPRTKSYYPSGIIDFNQELSRLFVQPTMNVCVKNLRDNKIYFNKKLPFAEDSFFNMHYITRKNKLGIASGATYFYRKGEFSAVIKYQSSLYSWSRVLNFIELVLSTFREHGKVPPYIQQAIFYEIQWRSLKLGALYPIHLSADKYKEWERTFNSLLSEIHIENVFLKEPCHTYLDRHHYPFLLNVLSHKTSVEYNEGDGCLRMMSEGYVILECSIVEIVISSFEWRNSCIYIYGFIKDSILQNEDYQVLVSINDSTQGLDLKVSAESFYRSKLKTNNFYSFRLPISTPLEKTSTIKFFVLYKGHTIGTKLIYRDGSVLKQKKRVVPTLCKKTLIIPSKDNITLKPKASKMKYFVKTNLSYLRRSRRVGVMRSVAMIYKGIHCWSDVWLYIDRSNLRDNAYYQFKHDIAKKSNIKRYYITSMSSLLIEEYFSKSEQKYVVPFGSLKHKLLFLRCSKIFTSFNSWFDCIPMSKGLYNSFNDILTFEGIYVGHGELHASVRYLYARQKQFFQKFVVSSLHTKQALITKYDWYDDDIITTGMPKLDFIQPNNTKSNRILFAPSWRSSLISEPQHSTRTRVLFEDVFLQSSYYQGIKSLLTNKKLADKLQSMDIHIDFLPHPIFKEVYDFALLTGNENSHIHVVSEANVSNYSMFITDFSSFLYEAVYLKIPCLFFFPDYKEFLTGNHVYSELEIDITESFGKMCYDAESAVLEISRTIDENFSVEKKYKQRMDDFFVYQENHRKRLYDFFVPGEGDTF